jgi:hypothetical protein
MSRKVSLDVIEVPSPCPESWEGMKGDGPVRFCGLCEMNVYNLSAMTRDEAEALVSERDGRLCVRFYRRADGTVTSRDCAPRRFAALRKVARRTMTGAAAMLIALLALVSGLIVFRLSGVDVASWLDDTVIGKLAKAIDPIEEPMMGEPVEWPGDEDMIQGEMIEPLPANHRVVQGMVPPFAN